MSHTWELRKGKVMVRCGCQGPEGPERQDRRAGRDHSQTPDLIVRVLFELALTIASTRRAGILGYHETVRRLLNSRPVQSSTASLHLEFIDQSCSLVGEGEDILTGGAVPRNWLKCVPLNK